MKTGFCSLLLSSVLLSACSGPSGPAAFKPYRAAQGPAPVLAQAHFQRFNQDWFSQLSPELQAYYAPAKGLTGRPLFDALHRIISQNNRFDDYRSAKSFLYAVAENGDYANANTTGVMASYSDTFVPGSGGSGGRYRERGDSNGDGVSGDFINCEHTWPQSFFRKREPQRSDLHHLFPTFARPNNARGHFPFGMASEGRVVYSTNNGSYLVDRGRQMSPSTYRVPEPAADGEKVEVQNHFDGVFEPSDLQKGNTARAMLYFYLRWHKSNIRNGDYEADAFWNSRVPLFAQWHQQDPADAREQTRHQHIYQKQGNRNPFIDIPQLVDLIGVETLQSFE